MSATGSASGVIATGQAAQPDDRRWLVLGVVGLAQLMIVLDITVMNIALPSAQQALHFSNADRQWVITAYSLAFGSLLLFGGRLGDLFGRKVVFLTGLIGFAVASAVGGASVNLTMLVTARACQGAFAALLAPAALSLLTTTFSDPKERGKAFGVYGAIAGGGGLVGDCSCSSPSTCRRRSATRPWSPGSRSFLPSRCSCCSPRSPTSCCCRG
jgi:MFS family permease